MQSGVENIGANMDKLNSTILATEDCVVRNKYVELLFYSRLKG